MTFAPTIEGNLAKIEQLLGEAAHRRADAVLLPECATTGYAYDYSRLKPAEIASALATVGRMAARFRMNVLAGSPVFRRGKLYNCLVVFDRQGAAAHCYAKCHLTEMDRRHFTPGNAVALFEIDGICATTVICHERRYPELVRLAVMAGARILFHPNAGMDSLAVSRRSAVDATGLPRGPSRTPSTTSSPILSDRREKENGQRATRRSSDRMSECSAWPTTATKRSS